MKSRMSSVREVAEVANVSIATVSRVLNNTGKNSYSPKTAELVRKVARELGYHPNLLMRGVAGRSTRTIGVIIPMGLFHMNIVQGIHDKLAEMDFAMILASNKEDIARPESMVEQRLVHRMLERRVDGVILRPTHDEVTNSYFNEVWERGLPMVAVDRELPNVKCDFAGTDDLAVGRMAAEHLLSLGHRKLAHLAGDLSLTPARYRCQGFEEVVAAYGKGARCVTLEVPGFKGDVDRAIRLLRENPSLTAVFAANDDLALSVYRAAASLKLNIPDDLSVVGCGNLAHLSCLKPSLTTVEQNPLQIGRHAAELLLKRIRSEGRQTPPRQVRLMPEMLVRESSAKRKSR